MDYYHKFNGEEIKFDSRGECITGILLYELGLINKFEEGINLHVPVSSIRETTIDFLIEGVENYSFIEFHQLSGSDKRKKFTLEDVYHKKKNQITKTPLHDYYFYQISKFHELFPIIRTPNLRPKLKRKYKKISGKQEQRYIENAISKTKRSLEILKNN